MKIYKVAQQKMIQIDPNAPAQPDVQVQNAQLSFEILNKLAEDVKIPQMLTMQFRKNLEDTINGVATQYQLIGLLQSMDLETIVKQFNQEVTARMNEIIANGEEFNMLRNAGVVASVDQLSDQNFVNTQKTNLNKKIQEFLSASKASMAQ